MKSVEYENFISILLKILTFAKYLSKMNFCSSFPFLVYLRYNFNFSSNKQVIMKKKTLIHNLLFKQINKMFTESVRYGWKCSCILLIFTTSITSSETQTLSIKDVHLHMIGHKAVSTWTNMHVSQQSKLGSYQLPISVIWIAIAELWIASLLFIQLFVNSRDDICLFNIGDNILYIYSCIQLGCKNVTK